MSSGKELLVSGLAAVLARHKPTHQMQTVGLLQEQSQADPESSLIGLKENGYPASFASRLRCNLSY